MEGAVNRPARAPPHTFSLPEGNAFLGFQGRSGKHIDNLQVVYAELVENW